MIPSVENLLICPVHASPLMYSPEHRIHGNIPWRDGPICCNFGCVFEIRAGIPRFVEDGHYAVAFGNQWQRYRQTQLDSHTKLPYSRQRLERCLHMPLDGLKGKVVLECGSGAGRFTEVLLNHCRFLVSIDLSNAVEANLQTCLPLGIPYVLCQADIKQLPLPRKFFDVVICLGVIQHTPSPEATIADLASHVKPGGLLVIDHYSYRSSVQKIGRYLTTAFPLRVVLKRLARIRPELARRIIAAIVAVCDPIRKRTCQVEWLDRIASRIFPSSCYYRTYPSLESNVIYQWNELDTYDAMTDWFKHFRSGKQIETHLTRLGFTNIEYRHSGNGVEVRAYLPPS